MPAIHRRRCSARGSAACCSRQGLLRDGSGVLRHRTGARRRRHVDGWIYGVSGVHPWFMAILEDRAAQEVWGGDNTRLICSSLMPAGKATAADGGYRLSGRWRWRRAAATTATGRCSAAWSRRRRRPPHGRIFWCRGRLRGRRHLAGRRPAGHRQLGHRPRRPVRARLPDGEHDGGQFPAQGRRAGGQHRELYRMPFGQIFVRGISTAALGALQGMLNALLDYGKTRGHAPADGRRKTRSSSCSPPRPRPRSTR